MIGQGDRIALASVQRLSRRSDLRLALGNLGDPHECSERLIEGTGLCPGFAQKLAMYNGRNEDLTEKLL
jgi:hypothetical protein